ncbi:MAG: flagellar hook capping FlgD N-terminal domain-containing protein [Limisphaerales bacterium]
MVSSTTNPTAPNQTLNQADFLNLLVTQMSSQDPLNPESDTDFAAQLAQFSALQTAQNTQTDLQSMQAVSLIGQNVTLLPSAGSAEASGTVSAMTINSGTPELVVNGQTYSLSQLAAVTPAASGTSN